jgi:hypothetical protein
VTGPLLPPALVAPPALLVPPAALTPPAALVPPLAPPALVDPPWALVPPEPPVLPLGFELLLPHAARRLALPRPQINVSCFNRFVEILNLLSFPLGCCIGHETRIGGI